jgi:sensor histidine kinase YesM
MKPAHSKTINFDNPVINFLLNTKYRLLQHTLFVIIFFVVTNSPSSSGAYMEPEIVNDAVFQKTSTLLGYVTSGLFLIFVYINLYLIIPRFLYRGNYFGYLFCIILCCVFFYIIIYIGDRNFLVPLNETYARLYATKLTFADFLGSYLLLAILIGSTTGLKVFKKWLFDATRINELEKNSLKAELDQLKSQVNPHFLFNTLNNLHTLIQTDSKKAAEVVLGLSDLLRYQLYDSSREKVYLAKDIEFIKRVLELEKIRKENFNYTLEIRGNVNGQTVNPFLFIPFVENAVKHGLNTNDPSSIEILFAVEGSDINFEINNNKPIAAYKNFEQGGLGLKNVQRRLELLYPGKHRLTLLDEKNNYTVKLHLQA